MKQIDDYLNQLYKGLYSSEAKESKKEMRMHILEVVNELISEGKNENEAIKMAINRFGEKEYLNVGLYSLFNSQKKFSTNLTKTGIIAFVLASIIAAFLIMLDMTTFPKIEEAIPFTMLFNLTNTLFVLSGILLLSSLALYFSHRKKFQHYNFN